MFSTFTGNSRRPRNVNLSGSAGNPFANTSWTPAAVSNTTKTISEAQADREKRQLERQRLKAAARIQRIWRGHKVRSQLADHRRAAFDHLYDSAAVGGHTERSQQAFTLLLSFCRPYRSDDLRRLLQYTGDIIDTQIDSIWSSNTHPSSIRKLVNILVTALQASSRDAAPPTRLLQPLHLVTRIAQSMPQALSPSRDKYFTALAQICQQAQDQEWLTATTKGLSAALYADPQGTFRPVEFPASLNLKLTASSIKRTNRFPLNS